MSTAIHNALSEPFTPSSLSSRAEAEQRPSASLSTLSRRISGAVPFPFSAQHREIPHPLFRSATPLNGNLSLQEVATFREIPYCNTYEYIPNEPIGNRLWSQLPIATVSQTQLINLDNEWV